MLMTVWNILNIFKVLPALECGIETGGFKVELQDQYNLHIWAEKKTTCFIHSSYTDDLIPQNSSFLSQQELTY